MAAKQQPVGMTPGLLRGKFFGPPQKEPMVSNMQYRGPRGNMGSDFRMPQKQNQQMSNQGIPSLPQNPDFLSRLPPNMMPEVDFSNIPQLPENFKFNPQMGQMTPAFVAGGPLIRGALAAGRNIPGRAVGQPGQLTAGAIRPGQLTSFSTRTTGPSFGRTEAGMGALGVGVAADATQGFSEEASRRNMMLNSPEQFGKDLAGLKIGFDQVMQIASNKAQEIGDVTGEYVDRVSRAYGEEMENQRMQEIDAQQGMQPFSVLTGPDMPLTRPEPTPRQQEVQKIDDILSDLEKKN